MSKFEKIFKDINFNFKISENSTFNLLLNNYLNFITEENIKIIDNIYYCLKINYSDNKLILFNEMKIYDNNYYIISLFIFKNISKSNLLSESYNNFFTNDDILNKIIENYKNFYIFYLKKEISKTRLLEIRGEIFKILNILILNNIIYSKKYYSFGKTIEYLSFDFEKIYISDVEDLKISPIPLKLNLIGDNYYLIGEFFTMIKKIFIENNLSNYYFKLNNTDYLDKLIKSKTYLNIYDLEDAIKIINDNKFKIEDTKKIITDKSFLIKKNIIKIKEKNKNFKEKLSNEINYENSSFLEVKQKIIIFFIKYVEIFLEKKLFIFNKEEKSKLINLIYAEFINTFKNAYFKINFKNLKEFIE
jgi:hypothetical protein